jgi:two-component system LytT family response regulator
MTKVLKVNADINQIQFKILQSFRKRDLPPSKFIRVHRSYIVNIDKVTKFTGNEIEIGDKLIPVSAKYRESVEKELNRQKINIIENK